MVGISDCRACGEPDVVLVTYALGSCIAVSAYDPVAKVGGMLHFMLPESALDSSKALANPCMFADTGIPLLFRAVAELGGQAKRLIVRIAGGAQVLDAQGVFEIGRRNYLAARKILWKAGILISGEAVGGEVSRTVRLELDSGKLWIREGGAIERELLDRRAPLQTVGERRS